MRLMKLGLPWIWPAALACFVIAGSTGSLYRFGLINGLPGGWGLVNVRHAHSHLMYFGWATPALMALIVTWLPRLTGQAVTRRFQWVMSATIVVALLAYLMFFQYGYQVAEIGGRRIPLSVLMATLNVLTWYAFSFLYFRSTWGVQRVRPLRFWDASLIFLLLASMGAWGVAVVSRLQVEDPFWSQAMTHLFLDLFSEGWFVLAALGLVYAMHPIDAIKASQEKAAHWSEQLIVIGLPVLFLLALPVGQVPDGLRVIAAFGGLLVAAGVLASVAALWPAVPRGLSGWRIPLALLTLKVLVGLGTLLPVTARWGQQNNLRILYLHLLLLGFISLGLFVAAREAWGHQSVPGQRWLVMVIFALLLSLLPLTGLWPIAWRSAWALRVAAWVSIWPVLVVVGILVTLLFREWRAKPALPE
jgi:hypothetical protein